MLVELTLLALFLLSGISLFHSYLVYPLTLKIWTQLNGINREQSTHNYKKPSVALIIAAYNEEDIIKKKIENSFQLEYPQNKINIIVFSDASDDNTDKIVEQHEDNRVSLMRIEGRVGKTACQNRVAEFVDEEILVFSDANSMYNQDAISELVSKFSKGVDCVVGELRYRESSDVEGESVYWQYESYIKRLESQFYSLVTGNGSIYAVKANSYVPQPRDAISDFTEPLSIVRSGGRVVYVPSAIAREETETSSDAELRRRVRIVTRSWNSIVRFRDLLNPLTNAKFAYQLLSHKVLRWLSPIFLLGVFVSSIGLAISTSSIIFEIILSVQLLFYSLAIIGLFADQYNLDDPVLTHVPFYFVQANYGMLLGLIKFIKSENIVVWDTSTRK
jgi:cellulose synthase/poly-beta-1,6-N-acetylglucosamine synthase-like glycosyltransferase